MSFDCKEDRDEEYKDREYNDGEYNDEEFDYDGRLKGFVKISYVNENRAALEADYHGLKSLSQFIKTEIMGDVEDKYPFYHFIYLSEVEETDLSPGSLDFYVQSVEGYVPEPTKAGKSYLQYGISCNGDRKKENEYLIEPNSYIWVTWGNHLLNLCCTRAGFLSFCNLLELLAEDALQEVCLLPEGKEDELWRELTKDSIEFMIIKKRSE